MELINNNADKDLYWFAMRATYGRGMKIKEQLEMLNIENFIPMHYVISVANKRKKRMLVPVINNLIFVHTTPETIKEVKGGIPYLQYMVGTENKKRYPIVVPDLQMEQFIAISQTNEEGLIYLKPEEINLAKGTKVRIHGGVFDGKEGIFVKVKGSRSKRVVIAIDDVIAVATADVNPDLIEVLEK